MAAKKKTKLKKSEIFWYTLAALFGVVGVAFIVIGIIGDYLPVLASDNWVRISESSAWPFAWLHLGYRYLGIILVLIAAFIGMLSLTLFAREGDRDAERNLRRAQRLAIESEETPNETVSEVSDK